MRDPSSKLSTTLAKSLEACMGVMGGPQGFADKINELMLTSNKPNTPGYSLNRQLKVLQLYFSMMKEQAKHEVQLDLKSLSNEEIASQLEKAMLEFFPPNHPLWDQANRKCIELEPVHVESSPAAVGSAGSDRASGPEPGPAALSDGGPGDEAPGGASEPDPRVLEALRALEDS